MVRTAQQLQSHIHNLKRLIKTIYVVSLSFLTLLQSRLHILIRHIFVSPFSSRVSHNLRSLLIRPTCGRSEINIGLASA